MLTKLLTKLNRLWESCAHNTLIIVCNFVLVSNNCTSMFCLAMYVCPNSLLAVDAPPTANAGEDQYIQLPTDTVVLDGSKSNDDIKIMAYLWALTSGNRDGLVRTMSIHRHWLSETCSRANTRLPSQCLMTVLKMMMTLFQYLSEVPMLVFFHLITQMTYVCFI